MPRKKISKDQLQKIVKNDLGDGFQLVESIEGADSDVEFLPPDTVIPAVKAKPRATKSRRGPAARDARFDQQDDEEIIMVEPTQQVTHGWDRNVTPKAAIVSANKKKIIGMQG